MKKLSKEEKLKADPIFLEKKKPTKNEKLSKEEKSRLLQIAKDCNCGCHFEEFLLHFVPCCEAVYYSVGDLE